MQQNTILQSVALLQTEIEKRLGELIFFISKCQRNHILVCTLFPTVVLMPYFVKSFAYQVLTYAFNHNAIDSKHFEKVLRFLHQPLHENWTIKPMAPKISD